MLIANDSPQIIYKHFLNLSFGKYIMSSHNYNTRRNSFTPIEESTPTEVTSTAAIVDTTSQTHASTSEVSETAILIINLEEKMTPRFHGLDNELLNLKVLLAKTFKFRTSAQKKSQCSRKQDFNP